MFSKYYLFALIISNLILVSCSSSEQEYVLGSNKNTKVLSFNRMDYTAEGQKNLNQKVTIIIDIDEETQCLEEVFKHKECSYLRVTKKNLSGDEIKQYTPLLHTVAGKKLYLFDEGINSKHSVSDDAHIITEIVNGEIISIEIQQYEKLHYSDNSIPKVIYTEKYYNNNITPQYIDEQKKIYFDNTALPQVKNIITYEDLTKASIYNFSKSVKGSQKVPGLIQEMNTTLYFWRFPKISFNKSNYDNCYAGLIVNEMGVKKIFYPQEPLFVKQFYRDQYAKTYTSLSNRTQEQIRTVERYGEILSIGIIDIGNPNNKAPETIYLNELF